MTGIRLSERSEKPIYRQLYEQLASRILSGELDRNFSLPPIRTAAKEFRISIITVKKAWEELERTGLIYSVTGKGCFIADLSDKARDDIRRRLIEEQLAKDLPFYLEMGMTGEELERLIRDFVSR